MSLQRHSNMRNKPKRKSDVNETKSPAAKKRLVAEYFCAQLYLIAGNSLGLVGVFILIYLDLCLDRNYVSMTIVEVRAQLLH